MALQVQTLSIVDAVSQDLREKLFSGELVGDAQLTESDVATLYGVARPTAKAAIEKLVSEGLLSRGTHKTARVPSLGPDDVKDLYFSRILLESEVVRRVASKQTLPAGVADSHRDLLAVGSKSSLAVVEPVVEFHFALVRSLGSARINRIFDSLMSEMRLCMAQMQARKLLVPHCIADEHEAIIAAIAAGDVEGAVTAMVDHLNQAQHRLLPVLEAEKSAVQTVASE